MHILFKKNTYFNRNRYHAPVHSVLVLLSHCKLVDCVYGRFGSIGSDRAQFRFQEYVLQLYRNLSEPMVTAMHWVCDGTHRLMCWMKITYIHTHNKAQTTSDRPQSSVLWIYIYHKMVLSRAILLGFRAPQICNENDGTDASCGIASSGEQIMASCSYVEVIESG